MMKALPSRMKKVAVVENRFEADLISEALRKEGIPCMVRSYQDTAYDGIFVLQKGWGAILVPEADEEKASQIIEDLRRSWGKRE